MNKTEKEMLELAAKAVGIKLEWNDNDEPGYYAKFKAFSNWMSWNPLEDNNDALTLVIELKLNINYESNMQQECVLVSSSTNTFSGWFERPCEKDPGYATRWTITRAAAECGKLKK